MFLRGEVLDLAQEFRDFLFVQLTDELLKKGARPERDSPGKTQPTSCENNVSFSAWRRNAPCSFVRIL